MNKISDTRAQFEAYACVEAMSVSRATQGGKPIDHYDLRETRIAWRAWQAAITSVQPSPAGQGDAPIKDAYIRHFGGDGGWLGEVGSGFIEGYRAALAARQPVADQHPDDLAVDAFAAEMKAKMAAARAKGRGGWEDPAQCTAADLSHMLRDHVEKGDPRDVANFCMMLHQRGESIR